MVAQSHPSVRPTVSFLYAWSGFAIMWLFWVCFVIFLSEPRTLVRWWPLPTIDDEPSSLPASIAAIIDIALIALFGLQHSLMARPWFKQTVMRMPPPFERCTYVHMANAALFTLILAWQPLPQPIWTIDNGLGRPLVWALFASGWLILFLGACSFGIRDLLGVTQMQAWTEQAQVPPPQMKTGFLYKYLAHPMYVGVLLGVWATPRMSIGHLLLALGLTGYVLIALRYEERDLQRTFGAHYQHWRTKSLQ
jgi:methanethiol S-methyltransferase